MRYIKAMAERGALFLMLAVRYDGITKARPDQSWPAQAESRYTKSPHGRFTSRLIVVKRMWMVHGKR